MRTTTHLLEELFFMFFSGLTALCLRLQNISRRLAWPLPVARHWWNGLLGICHAAPFVHMARGRIWSEALRQMPSNRPGLFYYSRDAGCREEIILAGEGRFPNPGNSLTLNAWLLCQMKSWTNTAARHIKCIRDRCDLTCKMERLIGHVKSREVTIVTELSSLAHEYSLGSHN